MSETTIDVSREAIVRSVREAAAAAIWELVERSPISEALRADILVTVPTASGILDRVGHAGYTDPVEIKVIARRGADGTWKAALWSIFDASEAEAVWHDGEFQPFRPD